VTVYELFERPSYFQEDCHLI